MLAVQPLYLQRVVIILIQVVVTTQTLYVVNPTRLDPQVDLSTTIPEHSDTMLALVPTNHQVETDLVDKQPRCGEILLIKS